MSNLHLPFPQGGESLSPAMRSSVGGIETLCERLRALEFLGGVGLANFEKPTPPTKPKASASHSLAVAKVLYPPLPAGRGGMKYF